MTCLIVLVCNTRRDRQLNSEFFMGILTLLICLHPLKTVDINVGIVNSEPSLKIVKSVAEESFLQSQDSFKNEFNTTFNVFIEIYELHGTAGLLHKLDQVFSNTSLSVIIAYVSDDYVQILNTLAKDYSKPLVLANNYLPHQDNRLVLSMTSGFELTSEAVVQYLEWFKWQNVAIIGADDMFWRQMVPILENQLMKQGFNVKRTHLITNLTDSSVIGSILREISSSEKGMTEA